VPSDFRLDYTILVLLEAVVVNHIASFIGAITLELRWNAVAFS